MAIVGNGGTADRTGLAYRYEDVTRENIKIRRENAMLNARVAELERELLKITQPISGVDKRDPGR